MPASPIQARNGSRHEPDYAEPDRAPARAGGWRWVALAAVLIVVIAGGYYAWRRHAATVAAASAEATELVEVGRGTVSRTVESSGTVAANLEVEIKCRASGEVVTLPFDISDAVKAGDLLCQLDPSDQELAVKSAQANVAQSEARLAQANAALEEAGLALATTRDRADAGLASMRVQAAGAQKKAERQKQLLASNLASAEEYETAQTAAAAARADLATAQIAVEEVKQQAVAIEGKKQDVKLAEAELDAGTIALNTAKRVLGYTTVLAPTDGVVASLTVQKGAIVASGINNVSGGTTIMTLLDLSRVFVLASVDESDIGGVKVGQPALVAVDSYPNRTFAGKVIRVAPRGVNASNIVTFEVKVEVTDAGKNLLKPAMTGTVQIVEARHEGAVTVPVAAVSRRGAQAFVTLPGGEKREVTLGLRGVEETEITAGVKEGDQIVVKAAEPESRWRSGAGSGGNKGGD